MSRIAAAGFTAIWVHVRLDRVVGTEAFPEFGGAAARHLDAIDLLIQRAARFDLEVFGYAQPPRGVLADDPFWDDNGDVMGAPAIFGAPPYDDRLFRSLCTSTPRVQRFLHDASRNLFERVPDLAGLILITASEAPSHCYARYHFRTDAAQASDDPWAFGPGRSLPCPRCGVRSPAEVIGEIVTLVTAGAQEARADARIIVWNWSWSFLEPDPSAGIVAALPDGVEVMADFERGGTRMLRGVVREVDEYSLSYPGPSSRFSSTVELARDRGLPTLAKLQLSTTHELATVPSLPVLGNIYAKAEAFARSGSVGFMGCWNMGNALSLNAVAFNFFLNEGPFDSADAALKRLAMIYLPGADPARVVEAWSTLGEALNEYPFSMSFLYFSPANYALVLPLRPTPVSPAPVGASWIDQPRGDDLSASLAELPLEVVIRQLTALSAQWRIGAEQLERALADVEPAATTRAEEEVASAWVAWASFSSTRNHYRLFALKRRWHDGPLDRDAYARIVRDELRALEVALPWLGGKEMGWHAEAQSRMFDRRRVEEKIADLRGQLEAMPPPGRDIESAPPPVSEW
ncbi:hypothetical protein E4V99_08340 [Microbacterium sp. dk485]|uniref:hypothetical protein n=2 Tax=Microbacterium TaxID=33882 RepID=UPI0010735F66|nr:hypothetical protein [Microbacterium sp. dk485]TFV85026.1 hypothetical protein E4V99_08340 [Microbacterium sp. dk485]